MRVLLVEDDEGCVEVMAAVLRSLGCVFEVATTHAAALEVARRWRPDVVLLDLNLDGGGWHGSPVHGCAVLADLRADPATAAIPVIIHSAFARYAGEAPRCLLPAEGFLPKPFKRADLKALLERLAPKAGMVG